MKATLEAPRLTTWEELRFLAHTRLTVRDNGPGIPRAELEQIFHRSRHLRSTEGSGLGLAIVRSIVEMHAARVWAESGDRGGACFHIALPGN